MYSFVHLALHPKWCSKMLCTDMLANDLEVTSDSQLVMHFPKMGVYHFSVAPNWKHQWQNDFNPTMEDTLEHLKVLGECRP